MTDHSKSGADRPYLELLKDIRPRPIFIMGPHRSGTTLFYTLLTGTGRFNYPSVYDVLNVDRLLYLHHHKEESQKIWDSLQRQFDAMGVKNRVYDSLAAEPDLCEEYCYALRYKGRRPMMTPRNLPDFRVFLQKIAYTQDPSRPVLLKNPYDAANFLYLKEVFPDARFVFIHRNPLQVMDSQVRLFHLMLHPGNQLELIVNEDLRDLFASPFKLRVARLLYHKDSPVLFWQAFHQLGKCCDYIAANIDALGGCYMQTTYPELCADPTGVVKRTLEFLGVPEVPDLELNRKISVRNRVKLPIIEKHAERILRRTQPFREKFSV